MRTPRLSACLVAVLAISAVAAATAAPSGGAQPPTGGGDLRGNPLATAAPLAPSSSSALAWGWNSSGQLGDGTTTNSDLPVTVSGLSEVTAMTGGGSFSLGLLSNGTVMAWGLNSTGQLGNGTTTNSDVPVQVSGLSGATAIAAGLGYGMALLSNGTVMAWGENSHGQLGNGTATRSTVPVAVSGLSGVIAIASGINSETSLAVLSNGTVMAWGSGFSGSLGNGTTNDSTVPVAVSGLSGVKAIAGGYEHELALLENGTAMGWGNNAVGQLGNGTTTNSDVPVAVSGLSGASAIAAGAAHSLALLNNGTAVAWGYNAQGELGDGNTGNSSVPVAVQGLSGAKALAGGSGHSLALLENGTVMAWGENLFGQLGNGTTTGSDVPVTVSEVSGATAIGAGESHSMAVGAPLGPRPTVSSVEPRSGTSHGGTSVTITGTNFAGASAVKFGATSATSFTVNSATSITTVSPAGTGTADVTVTTPEGTSAASSADHFTYVPVSEPPTVTKVVPRSGPNVGGISVEVVGTHFVEVTAVKFGSTNATSFTVKSETSITAVVPPYTFGSASVPVTVTTPAGTSSTEFKSTILPEFYFRYGPTVTSVSPNKGPTAGGTSVTIEGKAFESVRAADELPTFVTAVKFGSTNATSFTVARENAILATAPAGTGTVDVTVETPGGTSPTTSADQFTYVAQPTVTKVEPNAGPAVGGTSLTITGTNLAGATAVKFGSSLTESFTVNSETSITASSPSGTGTVDVTVTTPSGTSATSEADRFTYGPPAVKQERLYVTDFTNHISLFDLGAEGQLLENGTLAFPNEVQGPVPVVIGSDGNSLYAGTNENNFSGTVSQFTVASNGTLTLKEPPWVSTDVHHPDALALSPDGTSLYAADATNSGGEPGFVTQYTVGSGGLLTLKAPPTVAAGGGPIAGVAVAPNGASAYASNFGENTISQYSVGAGGVLTPMTPATAPSGAEPIGIAITPDGGSLYVADKTANAVSQYSIGAGGALSPKTPASVPAGEEPEEVAISPDGKSLYVGDKAEKGEVSQYTVGPGGALTPKSPASVAAERQPTGLAISPDGKNLYVAEQISNRLSQYRIEANGNLSLLGTARTNRGPNEIAFGSNAPTVTKVEPNHGSSGTTVTITGGHLTAATAVKFGASEATRFTVNSETSITAVSPAGTGTVDVTVTTAAGTSITRPADRFTYGPTVTKVEPNRGSPAGGTTVTITGTGFTGASAVKFGTTNAKSFTVNSATSITAVTPKVKGPGTVDVTVTTPAGTSPISAADQFTYSRK